MHVVIVGGGKKMDFLVQALLKKKYKITIINESKQECKHIAHEHNVQVIRGDGSKPFVLDDAGIERADLMIALTPKDSDNLIICQLAQKQFGVKRVFAIVNNPRNVSVFYKLGIDKVFSATHTMASMIEQMASVHEIIHTISIEDEKIKLIEISIAPEHSVCGKQLSEIEFPENSIVGFILRNETVFTPNGHSEIHPGDKLIILTSAATQDEIVNVVLGSLKK